MAEDEKKPARTGKSEKQPIIIIKKKGGHGGGHHGGAWKVAYADFVTAMMAFFLVMWLVAQSEKVKQNVAKYFEDPAAYAAKVKAGLLEGGQGMMDNKDSKMSIFNERGGGPWPEEDEAKIQAMLEKAGKDIQNALMSEPELKKMTNQIEVEITPEGLRVQLIETADTSFFDVGSAKLSKAGTAALAAIGKIVGNLNMEVGVEGHTDSRPYGGNDYTNWELSSDRANAARRLLEGSGVNPRNVKEVRGYADKKLRFPTTPEDPRNRRISIIVFNKVHMAKLLNGGTKQVDMKPSPGETHTNPGR